jgi:hypothetical protein
MCNSLIGLNVLNILWFDSSFVGFHDPEGNMMRWVVCSVYVLRVD